MNKPACKDQIPAFSDASMRERSNALPTPIPRASAATYTLASATPEYTGLRDTGLRTAQPRTFLLDLATNRQSGRWLLFQVSQLGASVSNVAFLVAMPSR